VVLGRLRQARLDGEITTPDEEKTLLLQPIQDRMAARSNGGDENNTQTNADDANS
jgi:hypothetical protein